MNCVLVDRIGMNCRIPGVKNINTCFNIFKNCGGSVWRKMEFVKDRSKVLDGCLMRQQ